MLRKIGVILMMTITLSLVSQTKKSNKQQIETTIQNYYNGYIYREIEELNKAFDTENGTMKVPILKDEKVIGYKNKYFKAVLPKWGNRKKLSKEILENCKLTILNIDIVDAQIGIATVSIKVDTITYIDMLSLHKISDYWKITNKIYTVRK